MMGIGRSLTTIIALGVMLVSFGMVLPSSSANDGQKIAINYKTGERVDIKPLDDLGNPYCGEYDAWDLWVYDNYSWDYSWVDAGQWIRDKTTPAGVETIAPRVDGNGYMLPYVLWLEQSREWRSERTLQDVVSHKPMPESGMFAFMAEGEMDDTIKNEYLLAMAKQRAAKYPIIPDWVMEMNPMQAQALYALEDGRWVIESLEMIPGFVETGSQIVYRLYGPNGELLPNPHKPTGTNWQDIIWDYYSIYGSPHFDIRPEVFQDGQVYDRSNVMEVSGYTVLFNNDTQDILAVWDYDGTHLYDADWKRFPNVCDIQTRSIRYGERFPSRWREIYYAQRDVYKPPNQH
ncbi:hypothetical protein JXA59_02660 [Patescibacteria group bacterium]|nr:hypothetical protein [Patescibacteria group bacterium]